MIIALFVGLWSWSAKKASYSSLVMKLDFISLPSSKSTLPLVLLQYIQQYQVGLEQSIICFVLNPRPLGDESSLSYQTIFKSRTNNLIGQLLIVVEH
jgi:hypothetical protein